MSDFDLEKARKIIRLTLIKIGIRCDLNGFSYLCYAIELVIQNPKLGHNLCKGLYVEVGKKYENEKSCVERSMRNAIENTYINKSFTELNRMFNTHFYTVTYKPTPGEFIRLIAEYYTLGLYKDDPTFANI